MTGQLFWISAALLLCIGCGKSGTNRALPSDTADDSAGASGASGVAGASGGGGGGGDADPVLADCESSELLQNVAQPAPPDLEPPGGCPSDVVEEGICQPSPPEPPPADACPGTMADGVCEPVAPIFQDWVCPVGWQSAPAFADDAGAPVEIGSVPPFTVCRPVWADACPAGTMPSLGFADCVSISIACPAETPWHPESLIRDQAPGYDGSIVYVDPAGSGAADGSRENPFPSVVAALAGRVDGDIVAIASGDHLSPPITLANRVALVGACADQTRLVADSADDSEPLLGILADGCRVSDLTITGSRPGIGVDDSTDVSVERVNITGVLGAGVYAVLGASVALTHVSISDTVLNADELGSGVHIFEGAEAVLSDVALTNNAAYGLVGAGQETHVLGEDLVIVGNGALGNGTLVRAGASMTLSRVVFTDHTNLALFASGAGTSLVARDVLMASAAGGWGAAANEGASVSLKQAIFDEHRGFSIYAAGDQVSLDLSDVVITDTAAQAPELLPSGIWIESGAGIVGSRLALLRNAGLGIAIADGSVQLQDVVIAQTRQLPALGFMAVGLGTHAATLQLSRAVLAETEGPGLVLGETTANLQDIRVAEGATGTQDPAHGIVGLSAIGAITRVALEHNEGAGLLADGATALKVVDMSAKDNASGIRATNDESSAVTLSVSRGSLTANHESGLSMLGSNVSVQLADVRVRDTRFPNERRVSVGIAVSAGPNAGADDARSLTLTRVLLSGTRGEAIAAQGVGTELSLEDVTVTNTEAVDGLGGTALALGAGAKARGSHLALTNNTQVAISLSGAATDLQLADLLVSDTRAAESGFGHGLSLTDASATLDRAVFKKNAQAAIVLGPDVCDSCPNGFTSGAGQLTIRDVVIKDTESSSSDGSLGTGISALAGHVAVERGSILGNRTAGIYAFDSAEITLRDVTIEDTRPPVMGNRPGVGLGAAQGAHIDGERVRVTGNQGAAINALLGADIQLRDLTVTHTDSSPGDLLGGRALEVQSGASATVERSLICGNHDYAFVGFDPGSSLVVRHTLIRQTRHAACADSTCADTPGGGGCVIDHGASAELSDFDIRTSALVGLMILDGADIRARDGVITANPIGINIQDPDIDLDDTFTNVTVSGNTKNYDLTQLPIPEASDLEGFLSDFD